MQQALDASRDQVGPSYLRALLRKHRGKVAAAARQAGIERESFYRLLRRYGIAPGAYR